MRVVYSERARRDIAAIYDSITQHTPPAAQRVEDRIRETCEGLADFPYAFPATDEATSAASHWFAFHTRSSIGSTPLEVSSRSLVSFMARA